MYKPAHLGCSLKRKESTASTITTLAKTFIDDDIVFFSPLQQSHGSGDCSSVISFNIPCQHTYYREHRLVNSLFVISYRSDGIDECKPRLHSTLQNKFQADQPNLLAKIISCSHVNSIKDINLSFCRN